MPARPNDNLMQSALRHHQLGELDRAAELYRAVLAAEPGNADAHHLLGLVHHQKGRNAEAIPSIQKALQLEPRNPDYHANLGVVLRVAGRPREAVESYRRALALAPRQASVHANLAAALIETDEFAQAVDAAEAALRLAPHNAEAAATLGVALARLERFGPAIAAYRRSIELRPGHAMTHLNLARALLAGGGRVTEAATAARAAATLGGGDALVARGAGEVLLEIGDAEAGAAALMQAYRLGPDSRLAALLANALVNLGRFKEASALLIDAARRDPDNGDLMRALGQIFYRTGSYAEALQAYARYAYLNPGEARSHADVAGVLLALGRYSQAREALDIALRLDETYLPAQGERVFALNYDPTVPVGEMVAAARRFGEIAAAQIRAGTAHPNPPDPERRLRVGLVSADLRVHPVARFLLSWLEHVDPARIELFAYHCWPFSDAISERLKRSIPNWRQVPYAGDDHLEALIRADGIDVLVDLSGHTTGSRLLVFARKPAPVAVTWLGYFATTGLGTIDHVLCNRWVLPEEEEWQWVERPWRLPDTYLCFSAPDAGIPVAPLPSASSGKITFGSANNLNKLSPDTIACWAKVLAAVPDSRLVLRAGALSDEVATNETRARFAAEGLDPARLVLEPATPDYAAHLARYGEIDIALDSFPYNGGTTTFEALWMGVPVVVRRGDRYVAHMGESILHNLGQSEWIAADTEDYVRKAQALAADRSALAGHRAALRSRLKASPLMNGAGFARHMEAAFRGMWREWCAAQAAGQGGQSA